jgi:hypothetical protein
MILDDDPEKAYIFTATKDVTKFDYMTEIQCKLFELTFCQDAQFLKWDESLSKTTTLIKKTKNNNSKHSIGCKVDGRILYNRIDTQNDVLDICQIEAAKTTNNHVKHILDKAFGHDQVSDNIIHSCNSSWTSSTFLLPTGDSSPMFLTSFNI